MQMVVLFVCVNCKATKQGNRIRGAIWEETLISIIRFESQAVCFCRGVNVWERMPGGEAGPGARGQGCAVPCEHCSHFPIFGNWAPRCAAPTQLLLPKAAKEIREDQETLCGPQNDGQGALSFLAGSSVPCSVPKGAGNGEIWGWHGTSKGFPKVLMWKWLLLLEICSWSLCRQGLL